MEHKKKLADLRKEIDMGIHDVQTGRFTSYDERTIGSLAEEIRIEGRRLARLRKELDLGLEESKQSLSRPLDIAQIKAEARRKFEKECTVPVIRS